VAEPRPEGAVTGVTWESVLLEYQNKLQDLHASLAHTLATQARLGLLAAGLALLLAASVVGFLTRAATFRHALPACMMLAFATTALFHRYRQQRAKSSKLSRLRRLYEGGVDRIQGSWAGKGVTGEEFSREGHPYEEDLNIFGRGSMFELLCTARTGLGRQRLAEYLLDLPQAEETVAREEAVRELAPHADLREKTFLLGTYAFRDCEWKPFEEWLEAAPVTAHRSTRFLVFLSSCAIILMLLIPWLAAPGAGLWVLVAPYLFAAIAIQIAFAFYLRAKVRPVLATVREIGPEIEVFRQGLELLQVQQFSSPKLKRLVEAVKGADRAVRRLGRLIAAVEQCNKDWFYGPSRLLQVPAQLALAVERWKIRHGGELKVWLSAWAEFEALSSLGAYAHEHPEDTFPEIVNCAPMFEANGLGHPLLPEQVCVRNDVRLDKDRRFYIVSGSNMAGKSTFLRALGINAVLASAGAPVRAFRVRMSCFAVGASVAIVDSLAAGKSKFIAEVERLREVLRLTTGLKPVLFVIDEILAGTNSRDRRTAAEAFVRALIEAGAVGALSTHDLALAEIAAFPGSGGINVHMESRDPADPFAFDYLLKPGVSTHSNALAIARLAGVKV
jgi:hypothetical protein